MGDTLYESRDERVLIVYAQNAREGRIMILTTHFMDEADLLGDRIAIMANVSACCPRYAMPLVLTRHHIAADVVMVNVPCVDSCCAPCLTGL